MTDIPNNADQPYDYKITDSASDKFCPAGKIECKCLEIQPLSETLYCHGKKIGWCEVCPWPSRQQPVTPTETVAAEIADMPDAEFKANCESLEKLAKLEIKNELFLGWFNRGADKMKTACVQAVQVIYDEYLKNHRLSMRGGNEPQSLQAEKYLKKIIVAIGNAEVKDDAK